HTRFSRDWSSDVCSSDLIMMIFTGLSSTLAYMKVGTVDYKSGIIFFAGSAPGTVIGAFVNKNLDLPSFNLYFGILLVLLSLLLRSEERRVGKECGYV